MLKIKFLFLLIGCFAPLVSVFAWDDVGHKTIAYIAWQQMTPQAREQAIKILRGAPEDSDIGAYFMNDARNLPARQQDYFMLMATWADIIRDRDFKNRYQKYHRGTWHYLDTFWRAGADGKPEIVPGMENDKENAVERLFYFDKMLRDPAASGEDKAIALAWILHLAGDIHQPLHASGRVTELEPKGDQGGNLFSLTPKDAPRERQENLHWFWDSIIVRVIPRGDSCDAEYVSAIAKQVTTLYPESEFANHLDLGKYDEWQQESFRLASTQLYPPALIRYEMPSPAYKRMAFHISEQQIALAGYRLGAMLNQIFGSQISQVKTKDYEKMKADYGNRAKESGSKIGEGKTDAWLWTKIRAALLTIDDLRESTIDVDVVDEIVMLKGTVLNLAQRQKAEEVAKNIEGVKAVKNEIKVSPK